MILALILAQVTPFNLNQQPIIVQDEGVRVGTGATTINCSGAGITCTKGGSVMTMSVPGGGGGGGAPTTASYVTLSTDATLTNESVLTAGSNISLTPGASTITVGVTGTVPSATSATTATALASNPADCAANQYATTIAANGDLTCAQVTTAQLSGSITNSQLASTYSGVGACGANTFASTLNGNAAPTCTQPSFANLSGSATTAQLPTIPVTKGGTNLTTVSTNQVFVGTAADTFTAKTLPSCTDTAGNHLNFDNATQTFSCGTTSSGGGGSGYVTVQDEATPLTARTTLNFTGAGVSCVDNSGASSTDCTISGGGAGSTNVVEVDVNFGSGTDSATTVVTGQTWVTAASKIVCAPTMLATSTRAEGEEDIVIEGMVAAIHTRVAGTGFTIYAAPAEGWASGVFKFHCTGA